ncbi:hypothetical protein Y032_0118g705 [Ancylostoma ceylanicum]|uniref:Uncharacterized protein n=1 Tax=Ancylostoma ceylanicum TaxID=53326 RepID=A0A016TBF0_9BILA|nr:hypothetical protein Y032_0118g705 [Ancylostoma ceylanicum]
MSSASNGERPLLTGSISGQLAQSCTPPEIRPYLLPATCPPSGYTLPPPLMLPPILPPLVNSWSNPAVTYTRVTVDDLLGTSTVGHSLTRSSMRTQLNPLACPFQPGFHRPSMLPPSSSTCTTHHNQLAGKTGQLSRPTSLQNVPYAGPGTGQSNPPNSYFNRGTMYFGQLTYSSMNEGRSEFGADKMESSLVPFTAKQELPRQDSQKCQRDIAKMIWETEDLYDNALKVIRQRRAEWKRERKKKKFRKCGPPTSSSSSPSSVKKQNVKTTEYDDSAVDAETIVRDILAHTHKTANEKEINSEKKPFVYLTRDQHTKLAVESLESDGSQNEMSDEEGECGIPRKKHRFLEHIFTGKEVTVEEIADVIMRMDADLFKKKECPLKLTKETIVNVIEHVQLYIIEELKLDPVDFVSVRLHSASSSAHLVLNAQDRKPDGIHDVRKIHLKGTVRIHHVNENENTFCGARKYGILTYDGREVTVEVIVKAIAKMVREVYGKSPPFKISKSGLSAFVTRKKIKILKALDLQTDESNKANRTGPAANHSRTKVEIPSNFIVNHKIKRKIKPIFVRRKQTCDNGMDKSRKGESSVSTARTNSESSVAAGPEEAAAGSTEQENVVSDASAVEELSTNEENSPRELPSIRSSKVDRPFLARRNLLFGRMERQGLKNVRIPLTPRSYRAIPRKLNVIKSSPKKLRQTIMKMVSPKKRYDPIGEGYIVDKNGIRGVSNNAPVLADYLSIRGRVTAAPTSIVIRTVEKKTKKRIKKGWRKSWI